MWVFDAVIVIEWRDFDNFEWKIERKWWWEEEDNECMGIERKILLNNFEDWQRVIKEVLSNSNLQTNDIFHGIVSQWQIEISLNLLALSMNYK